MIENLQIANFKCFKKASFSMRPLTVLTGVNGGGKSTLLQSLLLARQAATTSNVRLIELNGMFGLALGEAHEVLHPDAPGPGLNITLRGPAIDGVDTWDFQFEVPDSEKSLHLLSKDIPSTAAPGISNAAGGFTYLCAERLGPRDVLSVSAQDPDEIGVGVRGEFTAQVLALRETRQVSKRLTVRTELRHAQAGSTLPRLQTEAWVSEIIRPIRITAQLAAGIIASTMRFQEIGEYGAELRPMNTGFGVSYALPVIVAGLLTQPGDVILVENPEAHLHPAGQSKLGNFLARVAGSGVQVVIETHSDHVLNGARLAVAQDQALAASDMVVHYFEQSGDSRTIQINKKGELDHWPSGFFDQIESDLGRLSRARRE